MSPCPVTCLVADDHPPIRELLSRYLGQQGIAVVGSAADGGDALAQITAKRPDVALLDQRMPGISGIEVAREVHDAGLATRIALYTGHGDRALLTDALDAGVAAFVQKNAPLTEVVRAIRVVAGGGTYVDPVVAAETIGRGAGRDRESLTARERDILRLLAAGMSNAEIGKALYISPDTVRAHLRKAMAKLDATTRTEAVAAALRRSLIA